MSALNEVLFPITINTYTSKHYIFSVISYNPYDHQYLHGNCFRFTNFIGLFPLSVLCGAAQKGGLFVQTWKRSGKQIQKRGSQEIHNGRKDKAINKERKMVGGDSEDVDQNGEERNKKRDEYRFRGESLGVRTL